jgi:Tfp pilus assembly protein PilP
MKLLALVTFAGALAATPLAAQTPAPASKQQPPSSPAAKPPSPPAKTDAASAPKGTPAPAAKAEASPAPAAAPKPAATQQQPAPVPAATAGEVTPPVPPAAQPPAPEAYTYRAEGRRDPFQSLTGSGSLAAATSRKGEGPAGLAVGDISVRGVMQSRGALVAMIMGPDNKTYIVHQGDKLLDGTIKTITPQGLVVVQEVNDPLSLVKQREVRKLLRSLEDAKE